MAIVRDPAYLDTLLAHLRQVRLRAAIDLNGGLSVTVSELTGMNFKPGMFRHDLWVLFVLVAIQAYN